MKLLLLCTVFMVGCATVPIMDSAGQPTGETETKFDAGQLPAAAGALAPFAGPWGLVLTAAAGLVAAVASKDDKESK